MLEGVVHGADVQDRDGAPGLTEQSCDAYPMLIRQSDLKGFLILPRRWVVERTLAWLNRCRRLPKTGKSQSHRPKRGWSSRPSGG